MFWNRVKTYLPKSLFWRAVLILVGPIILLQIVIAFVVVQRHFEGTTAQMTSEIATSLATAADMIEAAPDFESARQTTADFARAYRIQMTLARDSQIGPSPEPHFLDFTGSVVVETLTAEIKRPIEVDLYKFEKQIDVRIETGWGVLRAIPVKRSMIVSQPHFLLVWSGAASTILVMIAVVFIRNQVRPIRRLAAAADAFGKGRTIAFRPSGAVEVRRAGALFLEMRERIERQIEQRTRMLSSVSHDLRTPLTRMKLTLAMAEPSQETAELERDVAEMEHMITEFLDFERTGQGEVAAPTDPVALMEEVAEDARRKGVRVTTWSDVADADSSATDLKRVAIRRCLQNLIDNASRYGTRVELSVRVARRHVEFAVEDDGPGIPEADRAVALRPFSRLDEARNQDRGGGVGLGLAIAQDIAHGHGGALTLEDGKRLGGLRVVVRLPR